MWSGLTIMCWSIIRLTTWRPSVGQPARVAVRRGRIGGQRAARHAERPERWCPARRCPAARRSSIVLSCSGPGAGPRAPERAGAELVAAVDQHADRAAVEAHAGQRVVELVEQQRRAHAAAGTARRARGRPAPGRTSGWSQPRQPNGSETSISRTTAILPCVDDAPRLEGVGDDLEEPLARAAGLRVDVALQLADVRRSPRRTVSISSQLVLRLGCSSHSTRFSLTLITISRRPAHPGALDPAPVGALVGEVARSPRGQLRVAAACRGAARGCRS